jgi:hypothetical protein
MIAASLAVHVSVVTMKLAVLAVLAVTTLGCFHSRVEPTGASRAPVPVAMDPVTALGTWRSSWGALILEQSQPGTIVGRWSYMREGQLHAGNLEGTFDGNVLRFAWKASNPTTAFGGDGWIAFDSRDSTFRGEWWMPPFEHSIRRGNGGGWYFRGQRLKGLVSGGRWPAAASSPTGSVPDR